MTKKKELPLIPLRGLTVFPTTTLHFDVARKKSILAIKEATEDGNGYLILATQKSVDAVNPRINQIYNIGVLARILQIVNLPDNIQRVIVSAESKVQVLEYISSTPCFMVNYEVKKDKNTKTPSIEANYRKARELVEEHYTVSEKYNKELINSLLDEDEPSAFCYKAAHIFMYSGKQEFLEESDLEIRFTRLIDMLISEIEIAKIERKISNKVKMSIDKSQKEYYLREQMKVIQEELGEGEEEDDYERKIKELPLDEKYREKLVKDFKRNANVPSSSPEYTLTRNYLDFLLDMPWKEYTKDNNDLINAKKVLDEDHYGLEKIKERIIEFLAVRQLTEDKREPILCFVGPPGVGKTSIVRSIAKALNRKYVRMSLGGVHDEAEIRGHRRTYVGAMPGRIIGNIKLAGSMNPVFLMDEIDKLASDYRGDPSSALLEVLDPEQNCTFRDNYLEIPVDLSKIIFITTANSADKIPEALFDRMEIIEMSGYTPDEKLEIAKRHLMAKQLKANGIEPKKLSIPDEVIKKIITYYTRESGVRGLEKQLATVMRKAARRFVENPDLAYIAVTPENLQDFLGVERFSSTKKNDINEIGAATGLAWTAVGGEILTIEVMLMAGKGEILLTGHLGDVMKESARTAISFIHSHAKEYGIDEEMFSKNDIHIHVPEGAIPKDGPSAGITIATAVLSALTKKGVKNDVAMTGEITLRGKILPIGGLKEKTLAAQRAGITTILLPEDNRKDVSEIPEAVRNSMEIVYVKDMPTVFKNAIG